MKKLFLISVLALFFYGCSPDEAPDTSNNCNCGVITRASHITLPDGTKTTTLIVRNNCTNQISTIGLSGHRYSEGQQYCNN